jgi:mono/diheme cytochrome c family protein
MDLIGMLWKRAGALVLSASLLLLGCGSGEKPAPSAESSNADSQGSAQGVEEENSASVAAAPSAPGVDDTTSGTEEASGAALSSSLTALLDSLSSEERGRSNPLSGNQEEITAGKSEYMSMCFVCHGAQGKGDGPAAKATPSQPSDLSDSVRAQLLSDGDRFAVMRLGIEGTAMPASGANLNDQQVWRILAYVETLATN